LDLAFGELSISFLKLKKLAPMANQWPWKADGRRKLRGNKYDPGIYLHRSASEIFSTELPVGVSLK